MNRQEILHSFRLGDGTLYFSQPRSYFDSFSDGFEKREYKDKLMVLAVLISAGMNLIDVIKSYMDAHSEQVLASLKSTLLSYIQFLRWGTTNHWTDEILENATIIELTQTLQAELILRYWEQLDNLFFSCSEEEVENELAQQLGERTGAAKEFLLSTDFFRNKLYR